MPLAQVAAYNHVYAKAPMFMQQPLRCPTPLMKRSVETDQDVAGTTVMPKIRRTTVMHNVHDVGSALLSLSLSANPAPTATKSQTTAASSAGLHFTQSPDCEPDLGSVESDKNSYTQPGASLIGDEEEFYDRNHCSDQGMLMDSAMFADRISACSRITVSSRIENTFMSVAQAVSPSTKRFFDENITGPIDGGCGALIVYR
jgi:hypothetical protein